MATEKQPLKLHFPPALLIIDMQNSFCHPDGVFRRAGIQVPLEALASITKNINTLRSAFHAQGFPVIFVGYAFDEDYANAGIMFSDDNKPLGALLMREKLCVRGTWDAEMIEELMPDAAKGEEVVEKFRNSAFAGGSKLEDVLRAKGVGSVVCCGTATNVCVESTVRDGIGRDWRCVTVGDACGTLTVEEHEATLRNLAWFGGVGDTAEVVEVLKGL